ncbi:MAG: RNA methyltransferase [Flavobacteriales bacterium]|nr:RNA methyltransferase [Flavobacteriales bacterium]
MNRKLRNEELGRVSPEEFKNVDKLPIVIVLDNIRSLSNIGSVFRTSDAFLVEKIYLCGITAQPPHREIQKTALGATESVEWEHNDSTLNCVIALKKKGYELASVEQAKETTLLNNIEKREKPTALVFGNEVNGISQDVIDLSDTVIEIPQFGTKHSLNISVSVGIVLWEIIKA